MVMDARDLERLHAHYLLGLEAGRLDGPCGVVEFERTKEMVLRLLPAAPALVADIGGGPGRYAVWLASAGYAVEHRDLVPAHVEQLARGCPEGVRSQVGDARAVDLEDASVDAVLLLGPLYHLLARGERLEALREAARIVKPGGPVFAAAISRWAPRLDGLLVQRTYEEHPEMSAMVDEVESAGVMLPLYDGSFCGYTHRPQDLEAEVLLAGLELVSLGGVEGLAFALDDLAGRLDDPRGRAVVLDAARAVETVPELLGLSPHLLASARRPTAAS